MSARKRRLDILRNAQARGCVLTPAACSAAEDFLASTPLTASNDVAAKKALGALLDIVAGLGEGRGQLDVTVLRTAIDRYSTQGRGLASDGSSVVVVGLDQLPLVEWEPERNGFVSRAAVRAILPTPADRVRALAHRLEVVRQRIVRSKYFTKQLDSVYTDVHSAAMVMDGPEEAAREAVYGLASLEGMNRDAQLLVLGRIMRGEGKKLWIEDDCTRVEIRLSPEITDPPPGEQPMCTEGLFHDGAIVVASGKWADDVFHCDMLGMPSAEERQQSIAALPTQVDFFGLAPPPSQQRAAATRLRACDKHVVVFAAHVHADAPGALQRLTTLAAGLSNPLSFDPDALCIVLSGDFSRQEFTYGDPLSAQEHQAREHTRLATALEQIAEALRRGCPVVAERAQFIFVPGPGDPTPGHGMLPAHPLPGTLTAGVRRRLPRAVFAPNPARLRFHSCEMVVYRDDVYRRLRQHCVVPPREEGQHSALVKTLADQGHLCPVPTRAAAVNPVNDSLLRLYPLPHLAVIADREKAWESRYCGCDWLNPGSFARSGSFVMYRPSNGEFEFNQVGATAGMP